MRDESEIQADITAVKNLLAQRDNDALEAIDKLVVGVAECESILNLPQLVFDCLKEFYQTAKSRIGLREQVRALIAELEGGSQEEAE